MTQNDEKEPRFGNPKSHRSSFTKVKDAKEEEAVELSKEDVIRASKMPEAQKLAYIESLNPKVVDPKSISFDVYAKLKKIVLTKHRAMKAYPKAVGVEFATPAQWDEIFKEF